MPPLTLTPYRKSLGCFPFDEPGCRSAIKSAARYGLLEHEEPSQIADSIGLAIPQNLKSKIALDAIRDIIEEEKQKHVTGRVQDVLAMDDIPLPSSAPAPEAHEPKREPLKKEKPEPDTIDEDIIESLNRKHAVIMLSGKCLIINHVTNPTTNRPDIDFSSVQDFRNRYQNRKVPIEENGRIKHTSIANIWLDSPGRKEYAGIVFDPSGNTPDGFYNLWQGFAINPIQGSWKRMERHLLEVICSNDGEVYRYVLAWLARIVQHPGGTRPGVAIVLRGKQGVGKGIFVDNFGKIFTPHYKHIINHHIVSGRFNFYLKDALFVFVDESFWGGDKQGEGILKGMVTEGHIEIEPKGKETFTLKMHANFIFASNNSWVVPADTEERRFMVLDVSDTHMGDTAYFRELAKEMDNGGREAMLYDLLHHDISGIDLNKFPRREALLDQIIQTWPSEKQFWFEAIRSGCINIGDNGSSIWPDVIDSDDFYATYCDFATRAGDRFKCVDKMFGKKLREVCPSIERKQWGNGKRYYRLPPLDKCRNDLENLLKIKVNWDE